MGRLPNHLWRRAVELFLLAGRQGNDGALPPVEETVWILRLSEDKLLEELHDLAESGVVQATEPGIWIVTHFVEWQAVIPVDERVRQFRERCGAAGQAVTKEVTKRYKTGNEAAEGSSTSTSLSESLEEGVPGEGESQSLPRTPAEAMLHPDLRVFAAVTGGRFPGLSQYQTVIEAVRLLRLREKLDEAGLREYLAPYWIAWSGRKRLDGRPYDPGNITWLAEWALNGSIPSQSSGPARPASGPARPAVPTPEETRRLLDARDEKIRQAVPMPEDLRAKMRGLKEHLAVKEGR